MANHTTWIKAIARTRLTEEQMDVIHRLHQEERETQVPTSIYWVVVEGIGKVHQGRELGKAMVIYKDYCWNSRHETSSLAGLDITLIKDGVEIETYFAPRPYLKGSPKVNPKG